MSPNMSSVVSDPVNLTISSPTTESWEMVATFWIEGVATPVVSICGLVGTGGFMKNNPTIIAYSSGKNA